MRRTLFHNFSLIDGTGTDAKSNMSVLVDGDTISVITDRTDEIRRICDRDPTLETVEGNGRFLLPGLIDAHLHITGYSLADPIVVKLWHLTTAPELKMLHGVNNLRMLLNNGFTTVRTCGPIYEERATDIHLREAVKLGLIQGPRLVCCGLDISMTAGHGDLAVPPFAMRSPTRTADGVDECIKAVRQRLREGVDFIKIHTSGGTTSEGDSPHNRNYRVSEITAICEEAHAFGRKVASHAQGAAGIETSLLGGVDTIEHGYFMTDALRELMLEKDAYLVPTLATSAAPTKYGKKIGVSDEALEKGLKKYNTVRENFKKAYRAGIKIASGSDCFNLLRIRYNREEYDELASLDVPPLEIIRMTTHNGADALGILEETGTIEVGKKADMIVLSRDPRQDITVLGNSEFTQLVMRNGKIQIGGESK